MAEYTNAFSRPSVDPASHTTIDTYDRLAPELSRHFASTPSRVPEIDLAHDLAELPLGGGFAVDLGCGDGRDYPDLQARFSRVVGIDPSEGALAIARANNPNAPRDTFVQGTAEEVVLPGGIDAVYAFNSLLHVPEHRLTHVCQKVSDALGPRGVFLVMTKFGPDNLDTYNDRFPKIDSSDEVLTGQRTFYNHSEPTVVKALNEAGLTPLPIIMQPAIPNKSWRMGTVVAQKS